MRDESNREANKIQLQPTPTKAKTQSRLLLKRYLNLNYDTSMLLLSTMFVPPP